MNKNTADTTTTATINKMQKILMRHLASMGKLVAAAKLEIAAATEAAEDFDWECHMAQEAHMGYLATLQILLRCKREECRNDWATERRT